MSKKQEAEEIVKGHILWSVGAGLIPFSFFDLIAVTAIQVDMLKQLAKLYEVDYTNAHGKTYVSALAGSSLARLGASAVKLIPGVGTALGVVSMSVLSGASTYAIGQVSIKHFETDGSLINLDLDWAREAYKNAFEKGKTVVSDLKDRHQFDEETLRALDKLKKLRDDELITEEEYEEKKKKLMEQL